MSQNLTQPEEIDHILMAMAGHDTKAAASITGVVQLNGVAYDFGRDESIGGADFSYGIAHKNPAHGLSDP